MPAKPVPGGRDPQGWSAADSRLRRDDVDQDRVPARLSNRGEASRQCSALPFSLSDDRTEENETMIKRLSHTGVPVLDQDAAKAFYTEKLGFEVRTDATMDGFRWLTVSPKDQPDLNILLAHPQPPMFSEEDAATLLGLVAKGVMGAGVIETDDIKGAYEE